MRKRALGPLFSTCLLAIMLVGCDAQRETTSQANNNPVKNAGAQQQGQTAPRNAVAEASKRQHQPSLVSSASKAVAHTPTTVGAPDKASQQMTKGAVAKKVPAAAPRLMRAEKDKALAQDSKSAEASNTAVRGTVVAEEAFSAYLQANGPFTVGTQTQATVVLTAKSPYKCNDKYPYKFKATDGQTIRGAQVSKKRTTLSVPFTPKQAGKSSIDGTFHYSVCTEDQCLIKRAQLSVGITAG